MEIIYKKYYPSLPAEEKLLIDLQKSILTLHYSQEIQMAEDFLHDYLQQIKEADVYTENQLLVINLFFHCHTFEVFDLRIFKLIIPKLLQQAKDVQGISGSLIIQLLLNAISILDQEVDYSLYLKVLEAAYQLMERLEEYNKKPIFLMMEGKYWLRGRGNRAKGEIFYQHAIQLAKLFGNSDLALKIDQERHQDIERCDLLLIG